MEQIGVMNHEIKKGVTENFMFVPTINPCDGGVCNNVSNTHTLKEGDDSISTCHTYNKGDGNLIILEIGAFDGTKNNLIPQSYNKEHDSIMLVATYSIRLKNTAYQWVTLTIKGEITCHLFLGLTIKEKALSYLLVAAMMTMKPHLTYLFLTTSFNQIFNRHRRRRRNYWIDMLLQVHQNMGERFIRNMQRHHWHFIHLRGMEKLN